MNYETATNRDLNLRMAELLGLEVNFDKTDMLDSIVVGLKDVLDDIDDDQSIFIDGDFVDYCNDWSATMPLAVEHGVSLIYVHDSIGIYWVAGIANLVDGCWEFDNEKTGECVDFETYDNNPLRAIVICLIKVLEAKK